MKPDTMEVDILSAGDGSDGMDVDVVISLL